LTTAYACDPNNDGFTIFDLTEAFPFEAFCRIDKGEQEEYYPMQYYLTQDDMENEVNSIVNPESFVNTIINEQIIYYRANKIVPNQYIKYLTGSNSIKVTSFFNDPLKIEIYDNDTDGLSVFDLTSLDLLCGSKDESDYKISFHTSSSDAYKGTNAINNPSSYENYHNPQVVYVRVENSNSGSFETGIIELKVLYAIANSISDVYACDAFDLTNLDTLVLGNQNPDNFTVTYYLSQDDAVNETNALPDIFIATVDVTVFCRVEENTRGSYAITSFDFYISKVSLQAPFEPYVVCDNDGDGIEVFDLYSKTNEIIGDLTDISVTYHVSLHDAELEINELNSIYVAINFQTVYVRVQDIVTGCYSIKSLDLIVQDCSALGVITINAFYDKDKNASFGNDEINFLNGKLTYEKNNDGILHNLYSSNGVFNIISDDQNDTYDITYSILNEYNACYNITTASYKNISVSNGSTVNYNFPITKTKDCGDIAVYLVSYVSPRPGFDYKNYLVVQNKGLESVTSGTVQFIMDASLSLNSVTGIGTGNSIINTASGFNLNFANLAPNTSETVVINMNVPIPTPLGALITNSASYFVTDLSVDNNTSTLTETVIGSYDPNDILESHGPKIPHSSFELDDYLFYTIRFQNVGTADAINVSIDNVLNAKLDESTIQMLSSSHSNVFTRTGNQLNWQFDNIHLPSENMDEPKSHGYVYYKIKPRAGYGVGDIIPNTAEIYFDFNPAVVTNTFKTEFVSTLSTSKFDKSLFSIYPNPASTLVNLSLNKQVSNAIKIQVCSIQGEQLINKNMLIKNETVQLNISGLSKGVYFLKANDGISETTKKLIVK
jgi:hypothetical protein